MDKKLMLEAIIEYYAGGNKAKMARILGITPQAISTWLSRNTFDAELIYAKCECINASWLLSGEGTMNVKSENLDEIGSYMTDSRLISIVEGQQRTIESQQRIIESLISKNDTAVPVQDVAAG